MFRLGDHVLFCGDALTAEIEIPAACTIVFDPPYDDPTCAAVRWPCASALVFTDPNQHFVTQTRDWDLALRWIFTWDTLNPLWVSATQPLRRSKLCAWFGNDGYDQGGELYGETPLPHRQRPRNGAAGDGGPWKPGFYTPDPRGKHLATVYSQSKTSMGGHPHAKPEEWVRLLLANCCARQNVVFDPFAGGGSSLLAADALGKRWIGIEREPALCEEIIARYERRKSPERHEQMTIELEAAS